MRGRRGAVAQALDQTAGADSVGAWMTRYLAQQLELGLTARYVQRIKSDMKQFNTWCIERQITSPRELSLPILERYRRHLFYYRQANGEPLSSTGQVRMLLRIRHWCRWLVRRGTLPSNPASDLDLPRKMRRQLPHVLSREEVEQVLAQPDVSTAVGLRDRVMLEVLYSTGLRRMELANLEVVDVLLAQGTVFVHQGKGRKDRMVPIGERARAWVRKYLDEVRPALTADLDQRALFLTIEGTRIDGEWLSRLVRRCLRGAGIDKPGAAHLFRHAAATFMLENGADLRYIQEMLGHNDISTTQIYTHVSIAKLQAIHAATHPGAKLERREDEDSEALDIPIRRATRREHEMAVDPTCNESVLDRDAIARAWRSRRRR